MKKTRLVLYLLLAAAVIVCGISLHGYHRAEAELHEEQQVASRTAGVIASLMRHSEAANDDTAGHESQQVCLAYLNAFRKHEIEEHRAAPLGKQLAAFEDQEVAIIGSLLSAMADATPQRASRLRTLADQLATIEQQEAALLTRVQAGWHAQGVWTGASASLLLLLQCCLIAVTKLSGVQCVSSLAQAEVRFGLHDVAQRYLDKRQRVDPFERRAIGRARHVLPQVRTVMDIPCGTGRLIAMFRDMGFDYHGADSSQAMVDLARRDPALSDPERVVCCNILDMPYPDGSFDCIFVMRLLHHVPDRDERVAIFRELACKTRYGVVVSYFDAMSLSHLLYLLRHALARKPVQRHALMTKQLHDDLAEAGLRIVQTTHRLRWINRAAIFVATPSLRRTDGVSGHRLM